MSIFLINMEILLEVFIQNIIIRDQIENKNVLLT